MSSLRHHDGPVLVVDLTGRQIDSWADLWDALAEPCGLPIWFGRNLDAWWDTIENRAISEVVDAHSKLVVHLCADGFFRDDGDGQRFIDVTNECDYAEVEIATR